MGRRERGGVGVPERQSGPSCCRTVVAGAAGDVVVVVLVLVVGVDRCVCLTVAQSLLMPGPWLVGSRGGL